MRGKAFRIEEIVSQRRQGAKVGGESDSELYFLDLASLRLGERISESWILSDRNIMFGEYNVWQA
jgi:hypothetical protein